MQRTKRRWESETSGSIILVMGRQRVFTTSTILSHTPTMLPLKRDKTRVFFVEKYSYLSHFQGRKLTTVIQFYKSYLFHICPIYGKFRFKVKLKISIVHYVWKNIKYHECIPLRIIVFTTFKKITLQYLSKYDFYIR